ncbi:growth hormone secretagogue receptor type 1-like [Amphiura filiformis]|uniref:growth hormone secretagogue receptor type 1-like n=1 Tax=Amphiura filiformis TaxID=82378 RepID=UPI003B228332
MENITVNFEGIYECANDTQHLPNSVLVIASIAYVSLFFFGVSGNTLVAFVIWRNVDMRSSTNYFLVNLCIADLLVLIVCMPSGLLDTFVPNQWLLGKTMCYAVPFLENVTAQASILTLMAIAVERYYVIWRPLEVSYTCTTKRTVIVCFIVWFLASICSIPPVLMVVYAPCEYYDGSFRFTCGSYAGSQLGTSYVIGTTIVFFFLPCVFLTIVYSMFANTLRKHDQYMNLIKNKEMSSQSPTDKPLELSSVKTCGFKNKKYFKCASSPKHEGRDKNKLFGRDSIKKSTPSNHGDAFTAASRQTHRRVIYMLGSVVVVFFICWLPLRVTMLWQIFAPPEHFAQLGFFKLMILLICMRFLLYVNSSINPLLYNIISTKFRGAFRDALNCDKTKWRTRGRRCRASMRSYASNSSFRTTKTTDFQA